MTTKIKFIKTRKGSGIESRYWSRYWMSIFIAALFTTLNRWTQAKYRALQNTSWSGALVWGLPIAHRDKEVNGRLLLWGSGLSCGQFGCPPVQPEAGPWVRKLGEEQRLKKDMKFFTTLLSLGLEKKGKSRTHWRLWCAILQSQEDTNCCKVKSECLWQSLIETLRSWVPLKERSENEDVVMGRVADQVPHVIPRLIKREM